MITMKKKDTMSVSQATSTLIGLILQMSPTKIMDVLHYVERLSGNPTEVTHGEPLAEVVFSVDKRFCRGVARAIAAKGMFIETQENFFPGKSITLSYENRDKGQQVKATGKIMSVTVDGIDVAFDALN